MKKRITQFMAGVFIVVIASMVQADSIKLYDTDFEDGLKHTFMGKGLSGTWFADELHTEINDESDVTTKFLRGWDSGKEEDDTLVHGSASLSLTGLDDLLGTSARDITLTFDLYAIDSWDAECKKHGKDYFRIGGSYDAEWTVNNYASNGYSSFKEAFPNIKSSYGHYTGSKYWRDSIYEDVSISFHHVGDELKFIFSGEILQGKKDESWGIDNVRITATRTFSASAAPEPGTFVLAAAGLLGLAGFMRKHHF